MNNGCFILCENCKKETIYIKKSENNCFYCKKKIVVDSKIEGLVVALNFCGIKTSSSCQGHGSGFGDSRWSFPCIVLSKENNNIEKAELLVKKYNEKQEKKGGSEWSIVAHKFMQKHERILVPKDKGKGLKELWEEVDIFARYIAGFFF